MAKEYLVVNNRLILVDGKLVEVPANTEISDLLDREADVLNATQSEASDLVDSIEGYINGSPKGVYESLEALQTALPSGAVGVYLTTDNGHWCYWNNTEWVDSGYVYQNSTLESYFDENGWAKVAVNAHNDVAGNDIMTTYATKSEVSSTYVKKKYDYSDSTTDGRIFTFNSNANVTSLQYKDDSGNSLSGIYIVPSGKIQFRAPNGLEVTDGTNIYKVLTDKDLSSIGGSSTSVFDITPYLTSSTSISVEGYNALREFVTSNKGGIVKFNMGEYIMYTTCFTVSSDSLTFHYYFVFDSGRYDTTFTEVLVNSDGTLTFNNLALYQVLANPVDDPTDTLLKIKINGIVYSIPVGEDYSTEISTLNSRVDSLANEVSQYSGSISSLEGRVSSLETASTSYAQASDVSTLDSRVSDIETTIGDINSILDNINGEVI